MSTSGSRDDGSLVEHEPIRWSASGDVAPERIQAIEAGGALIGEEGYTKFALMILPSGDYSLSFAVIVGGALATLPDVESFIRRVARFINEEPVRAE